MRYRKLGRTGLRVSEIGYGAWGIGGVQWLDGDDQESLQALRKAIDLGLDFIDTALAYGDGHSEELVGKVARESRARLTIATKVPPKNLLWPARPGIGIEEVFPYDHIVGSTEQSLRNLGLETIDLQQLHVWNPEWVDRDEWRRAFEDLKKAGKVRFTGVSLTEHDADSGLGVLRTGLIDTVQVIYNIFDQSPESSLFPLAGELDIGILARVPFDEGSLAGAVTPDTVFAPDDFRAFYFKGDRKREVAERVAALTSDLAGVEGSLAEIALAFCLAHPAVSTVIPGMRRVRHVETNIAVSGRGGLAPATLAILRKHAWAKNYYT